MAIDFPGSPTNGQTFTSGSVTYTWDGTKWTAVAAGGGGATDAITEGNTSAEVIDTGSDGRFVVTTEGTEALRVDSSGRLGVGTTTVDSPLHVVAASGAPLIKGAASTGTNACYVQLGNTAGGFIVGRDNSSGGILGGGAYASHLYSQGAYPLVFSTNSTQRAQIDSSGRLLVGTATAYDAATVLQVRGASGFNGGFLDLQSSWRSTIPNQGIGHIRFIDGEGGHRGSIQCRSDGDSSSASDVPGALLFSTTADGASSPTERMRIESGGITSVFSSANNAFQVCTAKTSSDSFDAIYLRNGSSGINSGTTVFRVLCNGNVQNTNNSYGAISDIKLKENIVDANSQWDDIKGLRPVNYNFKEGQTHTQIGLIAQEVELVSPGLVSESPDRDAEGNDLGTVTKSVNYSVLYMKAVKALQEAMERIETLEAKVAALETP